MGAGGGSDAAYHGIGWNFSHVTPSPEVYKSWVVITFSVLILRSVWALVRQAAAFNFVYSSVARWFDVASSLICFCKGSVKGSAEISKFHHVVVRLVSMINAVGFSTLQDVGQNNTPKQFTYSLVDLEGLDIGTRSSLQELPCTVEAIFSMIQGLMMESQNSGILSAPPPIIAGTYKGLSISLSRFHDAMKLASVPLPVHCHIAQVMVVLIHTVLSPLAFVEWATGLLSTCISVFIMTVTVWYLHELSLALEKPFQCTTSIERMHQLQDNLNDRLVALLQQAVQPVPCLSIEARLEVRQLHSVDTCPQNSHSVSKNKERSSFLNYLSMALENADSGVQLELPIVPQECEDEDVVVNALHQINGLQQSSETYFRTLCRKCEGQCPGLFDEDSSQATEASVPWSARSSDGDHFWNAEDWNDQVPFEDHPTVGRHKVRNGNSVSREARLKPYRPCMAIPIKDI